VAAWNEIVGLKPLSLAHDAGSRGQGSVVDVIGSFPRITVIQKENLRLTNRVRLTPPVALR
jgi:hypothetical protein